MVLSHSHMVLSNCLPQTFSTPLSFQEVTLSMSLSPLVILMVHIHLSILDRGEFGVGSISCVLLNGVVSKVSTISASICGAMENLSYLQVKASPSQICHG